VLLFAAASTTQALNEICAIFQAKTGQAVLTNYAATAALAQQVTSGADAHVFVSASSNWADRLQQADLVTSRRDLLGNELVLIAPHGASVRVNQLSELAADNIKHIALGDPDSVPAGIYAKQALTRTGIWEQVRPKVVSATDVRQALAFVETGAADAGIVYATDARLSKRIEVVATIDPQLSDPIRYPVLLLKHGASNAIAQEFFEFLASPESAVVFRKYGFTIIE
jgi:molybdate transport system substrate-binding protein